MYKYTHFIPENIAPNGAKRIGVYDGKGNKVCSIPLGKLAPVQKNKQYSFCALSDVHITYDTASTDFQRALTYVENSDCAFTCIAGDLTNAGTDSELTTYKNVVTSYAKTKPVYAMSGNHEAESGHIAFDRMTPYTGYPLYYSLGINAQGKCIASDVNKTPIAYGDTVANVFIMVGQFRWTGGVFSVEELQWLYETLEANRDKRCFVFEHTFPWGGAGNALGAYKDNWWTGNTCVLFENLMRHYKNVVLFHGHSHLKFSLQEADKTANYSSSKGYRSIHIPSISVPRDIVDSSLSVLYAESEGYIVDVYDDYIILNGRDFIDNDKDGNWIGIATYKIDTTLQTVEANTFTDSTGTIITRSDV